MEFIPSSGPHLHILLNHFPSVGIVVALGLFFAALYLKNTTLQRTSLILFLLLGLLALPTYISGAAARWAIDGSAGISSALIGAHQDAALLAFVFLGITGCLSWLALWQYRRTPGLSDWSVLSVLVLGFGIITLLLMTQVGNIGGHINHPEIGSAEEVLSSGAESSRISLVEGSVLNNPWAWPAMEAAHFIGMAFGFGVVLLVTLRVLGLAKSIPFAAFHRLLPLGLLGFLVNVVTGMFFFIADSGRYVAMDGFPPKIILLTIGAVAIIYFTIFDDAWDLRGGDDAPMKAKIMASLTILLWSGVIVFGRLLPYYGDGG